MEKLFRMLLQAIIVFALLTFDLAVTTIHAESSSSCTVMTDGSCVVNDDTNDQETMMIQSGGTSDTPKTPDVSLIPPLGPPDNEGYVDTKYGERQKIISSDEQTFKTQERLLQMHEYMHSVVYVKEPRHLKQDCLNRNELCTFWAAIGECDANPLYMTIQCAPACMSCEKLLFENRCPLADDIESTNVWKAGDLHRMFEHITTDEYYKQQYGTIETVVKPGMKPPHRDSALQDSPWVVVIDDFITEEECNVLIQLGSNRGYEQSKDVGARKFDGTYDSKQSTGRTSTNAWCLEECFNDTMTQNVLNKIVNLTQIPDPNSEYLQLLRYDVGQFYEQHHDYIEHHISRRQGVRILTVFCYLNDVEAGGGTNFPLLNITVMPKLGRVLIWPSVKDEDPSMKDYRTDHQALPVEKGIKYGANAWLHLRDFKAPYAEGCI